jgi:hypothetical protein
VCATEEAIFEFTVADIAENLGSSRDGLGALRGLHDEEKWRRDVTCETLLPAVEFFIWN